MQNPAIQTLSEEQQLMANSIPKDPPNPNLLPSPYLWSPQYISPAFDNYNSLKSALSNQICFGYHDSVSNQFNSALTQPLGDQPPQLGGRSINTDQIKHWELQPVKSKQAGGLYNQDNPNEFNTGVNPMSELYNRAQKDTSDVPVFGKVFKIPKMGKWGRGKKINKKK